MGKEAQCEPLFAQPVPQPISPDLPKPFHGFDRERLTSATGYKPSWTLYLALCGVATTLGCSIPVGYNIGVVNTPADTIKKWCNQTITSRYGVQLSDPWLEMLWSCVVSIFIVGGCCGSLLGAVMANKLGRKRATVVTAILSLVGAIMFLGCRAAQSVEMLILGRLVVGLSAGLTTCIVPMYLTEVSPLRLAGAMGVACPMGVNVGVLLGQLCGLDFLLGGVNNWPYLLGAYSFLVILCLPLLLALPESPKYLYVIKNDEDRAVEQLSRLRAVSPTLLTQDLLLLHEEARAAQGVTQSWTLASVMADPHLRLPLVLVVALQCGQQTSGINAVFYYSTAIFKAAGLSGQMSQYATIGCGAINVCTALIMVWLLPRVGRRPLLLVSVIAAAVLLACLAASVYFITVPWMTHACVAAVLGYVLAYGFGLGPIPYFIASELFEVGPRPAGMALGSLANWGGNFLVGMLFPLMRQTLGAFSFLVFATLTAALAVLVKLYFPETRGKTPNEVAALCSNGFRSRPSATPRPRLRR